MAAWPSVGQCSQQAAVVVAGAVSGIAHGHGQAEARVTVFGDSAATAMAYDPEAKRILGRAIDLRLEVAARRRVGEASCPYDGVRPPNVIERATELGRDLGSVVVVIVGCISGRASVAHSRRACGWPNGTLEGAPRRVGTFTLNARVVDGSGTTRARVFRLRIL